MKREEMKVIWALGSKGNFCKAWMTACFTLLPDTDLTLLVPSFGNFQKDVKKNPMHVNGIQMSYIKITGITSQAGIQFTSSAVVH